MNRIAPGLLKKWSDDNARTMKRFGIKVDLRLPGEGLSIDKAALILSVGSLVASLTVWGNRMVEYIVMKNESGADVVSLDFECSDDAELRKKLDEFFLNFQSLINS